MTIGAIREKLGPFVASVIPDHIEAIFNFEALVKAKGVKAALKRAADAKWYVFFVLFLCLFFVFLRFFRNFFFVVCVFFCFAMQNLNTHTHTHTHTQHISYTKQRARRRRKSD